MADDSHITRAFTLLQEATVLLSAGVESSPRDNINIHESTNANIISPIIATDANEAFGGRNSIDSGDTPTSSNVSATLIISDTTPSSSSTPTHTRTTDQQNVLRNFQSLFSPYGRSSYQRLSRNTGATTPIRRNRRSRQQPATNSRPRPLKEETWTHDVFCMASTSELVPPNREKKVVLQNAGLGRKKILFNAKGSPQLPQAFKETLEQSFPKLICGRGFELLRRGISGNQLSLIQPPATGYSVPFIKSYGIGQAILYVRPIQCDLDTNPEEEPECEINPEDAENAPKVSCVNCGLSVPITTIRDHHQDCVGNYYLVSDEPETRPSSVSLPSCSTNVDVDQDDIRMSLLLPSLRDIFPDHTEAILRQALQRSNFDIAGATQRRSEDYTGMQRGQARLITYYRFSSRLVHSSAPFRCMQKNLCSDWEIYIYGYEIFIVRCFSGSMRTIAGTWSLNAVSFYTSRNILQIYPSLSSVAVSTESQTEFYI